MKLPTGTANVILYVRGQTINHGNGIWQEFDQHIGDDFERACQKRDQLNARADYRGVEVVAAVVLKRIAIKERQEFGDLHHRMWTMTGDDEQFEQLSNAYDELEKRATTAYNTLRKALDRDG